MVILTNRNCVVLTQHRNDSDYNDFIGKFYHFPQKYHNLLSQDNIEFIYYEPTKRQGKGAYFGYGKLGRLFEDKQQNGNYFIEITEYKPFSSDVPLKDEEGNIRETGPSYNSQNAARAVEGSILDEICLDGGILLHFNADAHLIKVLGEQLIATEEVGILELVKNSYDANASRCDVRIENIPTLEPCDNSEYEYGMLDGPVVIIEDDGEGMSRSGIENGWMRPASTIKTSVKERLKKERAEAIQKNQLGEFNAITKELRNKHKGRIPLGEKGVGRFATHRLGRHLVLTTKTVDIEYEYKLEIDWDAFEKSESDRFIDLNSIGVKLTRQAISRDYGEKGSGTKLVMYGGRDGFDFSEKEIKEINRSILKLRSPRLCELEKKIKKNKVADPEEIKEVEEKYFKPTFSCPQVKDLDETTIDNSFVPTFTVDALVGENGKAYIEMSFNPPNEVPMPQENIEEKEYDLRKFEEKDEDFWKSDKTTQSTEKRMPACGPFYVHLDIWYRSSPWISGVNKKPFMDYLDSFGGISVYRDSLNVFRAEWGAEVDWLSLSQRHIKKSINISYYNIIGYVEIDQIANIDLIDQTDRQKLLNNQAFKDISKLVRNLVFFIEIPFKQKREKYTSITDPGILRDPRLLSKATKRGAEIVDIVPKIYDLISDPKHIMPQIENPDERLQEFANISASLKSLQRSIDEIAVMQDALMEQAGYGLSISVAVHEIAKITSNFYNGVSSLLKTKNFDIKKLEELREASLSIKSELKRLTPFRALKNEKPMQFKISKSVDFCKGVFSRKLKTRNIAFELIEEGSFDVYVRFGVINQIFSNLIDNSCYWLDDQGNENKKIIVKIEADSRRVIVADNGPNIHNSIRPYLFQYGSSLKVPPSGLGLFICDYYMKAMRGSIYEANMKDRLPSMTGAHFVLDFSNVPSKEE